MVFLFAAVFVCPLWQPAGVKAENNATVLPAEEFIRDEVFPSEDADVYYYLRQAVSQNSYYSYDIKSMNVVTGEIRTVYTIHDVRDSVDCCYAGGQLYWIYSTGYKSGDGTEVSVNRIDLQSGENTVLFTTFLEGGNLNSIGVDRSGRICLSTYFSNQMLVYSSDGTLLAQTAEDVSVTPDDIIGIDDTNHNIYYTDGYNWVYWGYDHEMSALKVARWNDDGTITLSDDRCITILYQKYYYNHYGCAELLDGQYLTVLSPFSGDRMFLLDSSKIDPEKVTESSTTIELTGGVSVSEMNLENADAVLIAAQTKASVYESGTDVGSVGTRAVCGTIGDKQILFVAADDQTITLYDLGTNEAIGTIEATNSIYRLMICNGRLVIVEDTGEGYCVESFVPSFPSRITISGPTALTVARSAKYTADFNSCIQSEVVYTSSDPTVLSIDDKGNASAWKKGSAVITVQTKDGKLADSMTVTVTDRVISPTLDKTTVVAAKLQLNQTHEEYYSWSRPVLSYIAEGEGDTLLLCELYQEKSLRVVQVRKNGTVLDDRTIPGELDRAVGFFAGKDAFYTVYSQKNEEESDETEILRVVKYDKNWNRQSACSVTGSNTYEPVEAGSLRMTEEGGILYIHTCHTMYASDDGYHHQANMTFEITEADMTLKDSYTDMMNLSRGYVSHSFNQFIQVANGYVYRVDHGDMYPRGIAFTRYPVGGSMARPDIYGTIIGFEATGNVNYTGASVGGMAVTATHLIVAYNQDIVHAIRNVFTASYDLEKNVTNVYQITNYTETGGVTSITPHLVQLNEYQSLLMWTEYRPGKEYNIVVQHIDNTGKPVGDPVRSPMGLSDCKPILLPDGTIAWYVRDQVQTVVYSFDPFRLDSVRTGWYKEGGKWYCYYLGELYKNRWIEEDGKWYHVDASGVMQTGWVKVGKTWFFMNDSGVMQTGWKEIDSKWYYFNASGSMQTGWKQISGKWYWFDPYGAMQTGWRQIDSKWYYFNASGVMQTGWQELGGKWYYFNESGTMQTGWQQIGGSWYYFNVSGVMQTGWKQIDGKWYYFASGGAMAKGWKTIDDKTYYFAANGSMAVSEWYEGYWLNEYGVWVYPYKAAWKQDDQGWWYGDTSGWYAKNCTVRIDGKNYTFDSRGYMQ